MRCDMCGKAWPEMLGERAIVELDQGVEQNDKNNRNPSFGEGRHSLALRWENKLTLFQ